MSSIKRFALPVAAVCITLVTFLAGASSAYALSLPGITPSGSPVYVNNVKVRVNVKNQTFKAFTNGSGRGFSLFDGATEYAGKGSFTLKGSFGLDADGNSILNPGGTVQIKGGIEALGVTGGGNVLMSADLTAWNNTDDTRMWGFNTTNIFCAPGLGFNCTNSESVYIVLNSDFLGFTDSFTASGTAHTTIPVPAAAWLFGSALGLLGWVRRRANTAA